MPASRVEGDLYVNGALQALSFVPPTGASAAIGDAEIEAGANIAASKLEHRHKSSFGDPAATTAATKTIMLAGVMGATGTILTFKAGVFTLMTNLGPDDFQVTFDLVNQAGASVLTAVITIHKTSNYTAKTLHSATIATPALVAGNSLYVVITATGATGTQALGAFAQVEWNEAAA